MIAKTDETDAQRASDDGGIDWPELLRGAGKHVVDIAGIGGVVFLATTPATAADAQVYTGAIIAIVAGKKYADLKTHVK